MAGEVFLKGMVECRRIRRRAGEEGHGGAELEIIGRVKDLLDRSLLKLVDDAGALLKARSEDRVLRVGGGFLKRADAEELRLRTVAQALHLGKDEPHPMGLLFACAKLFEDFGIDDSLRAKEALKIEGFAQYGFLLPGAPWEGLKRPGLANEAA